MRIILNLLILRCVCFMTGNARAQILQEGSAGSHGSPQNIQKSQIPEQYTVPFTEEELGAIFEYWLNNPQEFVEPILRDFYRTPKQHEPSPALRGGDDFFPPATGPGEDFEYKDTEDFTFPHTDVTIPVKRKTKQRIFPCSPPENAICVDVEDIAVAPADCLFCSWQRPLNPNDFDTVAWPENGKDPNDPNKTVPWSCAKMRHSPGVTTCTDPYTNKSCFYNSDTNELTCRNQDLSSNCYYVREKMYPPSLVPDGVTPSTPGCTACRECDGGRTPQSHNNQN